MQRLKSTVVMVCLALTGATAMGVELVKDGRAVAEIVIATNPMPQVALAARELRDHIRKISGAELPIVTEPDAGKNPVYVGESDYTRKLGLNLDGLGKEGFKIIATGKYLALLGRDAIFPFYPRGHKDASGREQLLAEWQAYAGEKLGFPFLDLYDPRYYNAELGFSFFDPSGTLFAVYDFLEQLGVRWYMPGRDFGTVIPAMRDIVVKKQNITRRPEFEWRFLRVGWGKDTDTLLWCKRQKLGVSEMVLMSHGTPNITEFAKETHPEYFARVGAGRILPRLAPPLRDAMVLYADKMFERYPELRHVSVGPADAFTSIDERDVAAGWLREERGGSGRLSDYVWTFINDVAAGVGKTHPDKIVMGLAYSYYREPPRDIQRLHDNVGITYCQSRVNLRNSGERQRVFAEREQWLKMIPSGEMFLWEYFLWHEQGSQLRGVPVIFTKIMQADMLALRGKSRGEYVEAWPLQGGGLWGLNHLTIYLQARLYWEPDLDLAKLLDEYYTLFYGPAAAEMRSFFEFAEEVWMRPDTRTISLAGGFLRQADVARFFEMLDRARAAAGDGVYAQRVKLIIEECQPMREIHATLKRVGPDFLAPRLAEKPRIDGDLGKPVWRDGSGEFRAPFYLTRDLNSGEVRTPETIALLRWADDDSGLYIAVACAEPAMNKLHPGVAINDSVSIYDGDFVEVFIERPGRSAFKMVVNPLGVFLTDIVNWNPGMNLAVRKRAVGWDVEMFIPRAGLDGAAPPETGEPWGINVCRSRFVTGKAENSAIAPTGGRFFTPPKFGNIIIKR